MILEIAFLTVCVVGLIERIMLNRKLKDAKKDIRRLASMLENCNHLREQARRREDAAL